MVDTGHSVCSLAKQLHCLKSFRIQSYSGPYFPAFRLNINSVSLHIQSEWGKIGTRITPNTDTFYAVLILLGVFLFYSSMCRSYSNAHTTFKRHGVIKNYKNVILISCTCWFFILFNCILIFFSQPTFICSKSAMEAQKQ